MAGLNFQLGSGKVESKAGSLASRMVLFLFGTPFAAFGLFAVWGGIKKFHDTGSKEGIFIALFGLVFASVGFGQMYAATTAERRRRAAEEKWRAQTDGGSKPWLARADWAAGRIKYSNNALNVALGISAAAFCGMGGIFTFPMLTEELRKGNHKALLVLIFPLAGIVLLAAFVRGMLAQRRYGDCFFELASIPGAVGGTLEGMIQTGARLTPEHALHLNLSCIRRVVSGSGNNRSTRESILWQDGKVFRPNAGWPEPEPGRSGIPVYFKIPAGQPECFVRGNEAVLWRLEAKAKMAGPDFSVTFEVPVFKVAGVDAGQTTEADPTAAWQMPVEEIRRDERSRIQISDGPRGREFYFPAARNIGTTLYLTLMFLIWTAFTLATYFLFKSLFFKIVFTALAVIMFFAVLDRWFKSSRVNVDPTGVYARKSWLIFSRSKNFTISDIRSIELKQAFNVGSHAFYSLQLVLPSGKTAVIATDLPDKLEAEWLVREMTKALGRHV